AGGPPAPPGMKSRGSNKPPTHFPGRPKVRKEQVDSEQLIRPGDSLAARARRLKKQQRRSEQ
ncbi:MAG: hypothetical protein ACYS8L_04880, partial [Planctomycetota bacterium]